MERAVIEAMVEGERIADDTLPSDRRGAIEQLREQHRRVRIAQARELALAAHYAELSGDVVESGVVIPGTERLLRLSGDGTPAVAEFAGLELAVALGVPEEEAYTLMTEALAIKYRLPHLWALTMAGFAPVWVARKVDGLTRELPLTSVLDVDAALAPHISELPPGRLLAMVEGLVLVALPADVAEEKRALARESRGVWFESGEGGVSGVRAVLSSADAVFLDSAVARLASILAAGGSADSHDVRRATGLGLLASPARALQLLQANLLDELEALVDEEGEALDLSCPAKGQRGHTCGSVTVDPSRLLPESRLYVHLTDQALRDGTGVARVEGGLKPLLTGWLHDLLGDTRVRVTPVLDLEGMAPVDSYEAPERMREAVVLRNPYSVFPFSRRRARRLDMDHTKPFDFGDPAQHGPDGSLERPARPAPAGQTRAGNLGGLARRQHRAATHGGYRKEQLYPGVFLWITPLGQRALVTPSGSRRL